MSETTPEQAKAAAEVLRAFQMPPHVWTQSESEAMGRSARILDGIAGRLEREQAAKAKRDKRIEELADLLFRFRSDYPTIGDYSMSKASGYHRYATVFLDRYPCLLDEDAGQ
jgi:hypothetical protein